MGVWQDVVTRENVIPEKLTLIYNGIDPIPFQSGLSSRDAKRRELNLNEVDIVIVIVANLIPYKGYEDVVQAVSLIIKEVPHIRVLCIYRRRQGNTSKPSKKN